MDLGSHNVSSTSLWRKDDASTTETPFSPEEEDAIVTLVVVLVGVIAAIVILFSMGIFLDCKFQKKESPKRRRLKLKKPPLGRSRRDEDGKSLASDMCPTGSLDPENPGDIAV
ncbi:uncharacterized protein LOC105700828 [Orussus abietinus]|uniref:uncharacterized protein LOC105700828 n=1 Tax=Orussus abietinus TaxID=222816 RepID=UPI00062659F9|nr:uncharacterized protein LOC105700828 [Orussus abietinus]